MHYNIEASAFIEINANKQIVNREYIHVFDIISQLEKECTDVQKISGD